MRHLPGRHKLCEDVENPKIYQYPAQVLVTTVLPKHREDLAKMDLLKMDLLKIDLPKIDLQN